MKLCMNVALHRIFQIFQTFKKKFKLFQIFQSENKFFLNLSDSNTTNFVKDISIIPAEEIVGQCKNQFKFWIIIIIIIIIIKKSRTSIQYNFRKSHHISWNLDELLKYYKTKNTGVFPSRWAWIKTVIKSPPWIQI